MKSHAATQEGRRVALAAALAALDEILRDDMPPGAEDEPVERSPRMKRRGQRRRKNRYTKMCAWTQVLRDKRAGEQDERNDETFSRGLQDTPCTFVPATCTGGKEQRLVCFKRTARRSRAVMPSSGAQLELGKLDTRELRRLYGATQQWTVVLSWIPQRDITKKKPC